MKGPRKLKFFNKVWLSMRDIFNQTKWCRRRYRVNKQNKLKKW